MLCQQLFQAFCSQAFGHIVEVRAASWADQISIALKPNCAIRSQACSIGNSMKWIEEVDSRIRHFLAALAFCAGAENAGVVITTAPLKPTALRKLRRFRLSFIAKLTSLIYSCKMPVRSFQNIANLLPSVKCYLKH